MHSSLFFLTNALTRWDLDLTGRSGLLLALPPYAKAVATSSPEWVSDALQSFERVGLEEEEAVLHVPLHQLQVLGKINVVDGFAAEDDGG
ncbi:hypothetical protein ACFX2J_018948 [Malus domestica]